MSQDCGIRAIIPLAGRGTRLRPHTDSRPKPLIRIAGKPILAHLLDQLCDAGIREVVFIVGYMGSRVQEYVSRAYPKITARYETQEMRNGTAGAVSLARKWIDDKALILFADTIFNADLGAIGSLSAKEDGLIWVKEVEDYQRYGVVISDENGWMRRIIEKPSEPVSKLAGIGLYYVRNAPLLFEGIDAVLAESKPTGREYYLTDAFQYMTDRGSRIRPVQVDAWYDAGSADTLLAANRRLLEQGRCGTLLGARIEESAVSPDARIEWGARIKDSRLGPSVCVEAGALVAESELTNCIVGRGAEVEQCRLRDSIIGAGAKVRGVDGMASVGEMAVVKGEDRWRTKPS